MTSNESPSVLRMLLPTSNVNWANFMAATLADPNFQANFASNTTLAPIVDQQNLTLVFTDEMAHKNSLDVETDVLPDAVVHMIVMNRTFPHHSHSPNTPSRLSGQSPAFNSISI